MARAPHSPPSDGGFMSLATPARDGTLGRVAGIAYLATFATSIPALALRQAFLAGDAGTWTLPLALTLEVLLAVACVTTAVALTPVLARDSPALALGFLASRTIEASLILVGVLALGAVAELGIDNAPGFIALHDGAFLIGPGFAPVANALLLGTALLRDRRVPRVIPTIGLIGAPILLVSSTLTLWGVLDQVSPLAGLAALPIAAWEFAIGVWLTWKGLTPFPNVATSPSPPGSRR